jgi:starch synthase
MKILMVCSEFAPIAKTGGLADAVSGLSTALTDRGHDVRVLIPHYDHLATVAAAPAILVADSGGFRFHAWPFAGKGPRLYSVELVGSREPVIYTGDERDALRFLQLSVAALRFGDAIGWRPEILHSHDWQTGLVSALPGARELAPTVLTIHNMGHQGAYSAKVLAGNEFADLSKLVDPRARSRRAINYLRAGILSATEITTVSPTYAKEIQTRALGMGLHTVIAPRARDLSGILNGIDTAIWNPENDPYLRHHFSAQNLAGKAELKGSLMRELGLTAGERAPLIGVVSRLERQKGIDILISAFPRLLRKTRAQFAVHGRGRAEFSRKLSALARRWPSRLWFDGGFEEALAHNIIAASDMVLLPSRYEPCGLVQLYAQRYATIPVAHRTGGLIDTIEPFDPATARGTGVMFPRLTARHLTDAVAQALEWFDTPELWQQMVANAMRADFSWRRQVEPYEALYRRIANADGSVKFPATAIHCAGASADGSIV